MECQRRSQLLATEDWWSVWLGLGIILVATVFFFSGSTLKPLAVSPPSQWSAFSQITSHFGEQWPSYVLLWVVFSLVFTISIRIMGLKVNEYIPGFAILFVVSTLIMVASSSQFFKRYNIEAPLVALILGLLIGNFFRLPKWLDTSLRTEYYIKTGIVLLGATLPLTLIIKAGPIAFIQATIVSVSTWLVIFYAATRIFMLEKQFGAVLGAGGAVCGVSASIAVGGAVKARKEHIAIGISIVSIWAIVMIFVLPIASRTMGLMPGVAGAWIGTSEFADAAGYAAAASIPDPTEAPIKTFTLMKVIGRDIWIGIWAFVLSIISVMYWERRSDAEPGARVSVIWERFPKFVIGFFLASIIISVISLRFPGESFDEQLKPLLISPIKTLRTWTFVFTFICIGLTTRFRELAKFGWEPFWAFTIGVAVNVPLGFVLSTIVFKNYWAAVQ